MENADKEERALDALISASLLPSEKLSALDRELIKDIQNSPESLNNHDEAILGRIDRRLESLLAGIEYVGEMMAPTYSSSGITMAMNRNFDAEVQDPKTEAELKKKREELLKKIRDQKKQSDDNQRAG